MRSSAAIGSHQIVRANTTYEISPLTSRAPSNARLKFVIGKPSQCLAVAQEEE